MTTKSPHNCVVVADESSQPDAIDWLGLSRLGSPDPSSRDGGGRPAHEGGDASDSDEFSAGFQLSPRQPSSRATAAAAKTAPKSGAPQSTSARNQSPPRTPPKTQPLKGTS